MEKVHPINPFIKPVTGEIMLPGSKSITNRALILACLCQGPTTLQNALFSDDTLVMVKALQILGFPIQSNTPQNTLNVRGFGGKIPETMATIIVGDAGTAARFLPALVALQPKGVYHFDGTTQMRTRPIEPLLKALEGIGAISVTYLKAKGHFPFTIETNGIKGGTITVDASSSSQILSALLMVAPLAEAPLTIQLEGDPVPSKPFIDLTLEVMNEFHQPFPRIDTQKKLYAFNKHSYKIESTAYFIEPDATAASYFLALALVTGSNITLPGLTHNNIKQGDARFAYIIEPLGLNIIRTSSFWHVERVSKPSMQAVKANFNDISDTFMTMAAIAPLLQGTTVIEGIAHTRHQETDRPFAVANELKKLGQEASQTTDTLSITPRTLTPGDINPYNDHRISMSFSILGSFNLYGNGDSWVRVKNHICCSKTFPWFFDILDKLRTNSAHS